MEAQKQKVDQLYKIRHSAAHILAEAVTTLFPGTQPTIGPVTQDGFFYDFFSPDKTFSESDLAAIEAKMREIAKVNHEITGKNLTKAEALAMYPNNKFKRELIENLEEGRITVYWQGEFYDLCRGGHTVRTGEVEHFKLTMVAGAHWRADVTREPLQRIYGVAFESADKLDAHLKKLEEAKLYDHRLLGKKLDLFSFFSEAPGSVFYHDKGTVVYNLLVDYMRGLQRKAGYQEIRTPLVLKEKLWHTSGHFENFKENMFFVPESRDSKSTKDDSSEDSGGYAVRPMNCPCAMLLFSQGLKSYNNLPLRLSEFGMVHRKELSGVLHGLFRVRVFTQDDAHIFCTTDQIQDEVTKLLQLADTVYKKFGFEKIQMKLSTKPDNAIGSDELWEVATDALAKALESQGHEVVYNHGEGAFYGPKIEMVITDAIGREWQCGTVQIDPFMPERFGLEYVDSDQSKKTPVVIHKAIYGSIERFFGVVLEHCKGRLPFWLSPVQATVLPITDSQNEYAKELADKLNEAGIRTEADLDNEKISAKIRKAQLSQIHWMLVVGKREQEAGQVTLRNLDGEQTSGLTAEQLIEMAKEKS